MSLSALHDAELRVSGRSFIGGSFIEAASLSSVAHVNPSTGRVQAHIALGGAAEIGRAVTAAARAQERWVEISIGERIQCFKRLGALVESDADRLSYLGARESGIPQSLQFTSLAVGWIDHYMGWIDKIQGEHGESYSAPGFNYTRREPYGVVGVIIPWNGPLVAICMMAIPALAAGNGVVLKPASLAPFVALRMAELINEAGFPSGLFNVVPGESEAGEALVRHPGIAKVAFTGGEHIARRIAQMAAESLKPIALELGGKSANLVFADADLDTATEQAVFGAFGLSGQGCVNPTRLLVHHSRYVEVLDRVAELSAAIALGDPLDPATSFGPVISASACDRILGVIEKSKRDARLIAGGARVGGDLAGGYFIQPTVFGDVRPGSDLEQQEVFGPVLAVSSFQSDEEALSVANDTRYGLGAYLHTRDLDRAHSMAARLQAGYVSVNGFAAMSPMAPFGGYKQSGYGRVGGWAGMEEYLQLKNVFVARRAMRR